ncbi:iron complex outermembrane receptor protein [Sphingomonas sp. BE138]|uniref:TonB-dependent receptor plug domain-containing protein n=1 Tax=Sphingomonas sp. BE138 TaxID=2817845 RepID=UPI0028634967|nr:TonB-dependent receptor [Sphingomonas sp. BE138]MDR6789998.1 iron complex outermembrane receptor protein [Sphingomonas sp. BE138]
MRTCQATLLASAALLLAMPAAAQTAPATGDAEPAAEAPADNEVVVTGTRAPGRSRLDTVSPVDVLTGDALRAQGTTELADALSTVAPSIDFPRQAAVDGTDAIRPATLRGLSPDQTLVLVNGTRAHASALLNINGSIGRGSAAVDLNTIPTVALDRVEVLREGASAQYGSDAIAGVINLRLREERSGGGANVTFGTYATKYDAARISRSVRDGETVTFAGWKGFGLGSDGFLTVSGEYVARQPTNRADIDPRGSAPRIRARFGDPELEQGTVYVNAAVPLGDGDWTAYANGGFQQRDAESAAFPRLAGIGNTNADEVSGLYPDGFLPLIGTRSKDYTATGGVRGTLGAWNADLTVSYGRNTIDFATRDSANTTYGNASLRNFDSGSLSYDQLVAGLDLAREYTLGAAVINVAAGAEYRREGFEIGAGQPESYNRAPGARAALQSGAQGFVGFQPANEVDVHRSNGSLYLDVEARLWDRLTLGAAARGESYSDFGETATAKLSARYDVAPWLAFRGSVSTGFRAPSLQQQYYTSTQTQVIGNLPPQETGLYPVSSGIAQALGALPLDPEKSRNYSVGTVVRFGGFSLTVDGYHIRIRDQIALSENILASASQQVGALLAPFNVQAARFFINGIQTTTKGLDIVAAYTLRSESLGNFNLSAAANLNDISVDRVPTSTAALNPAPSLFGRNRVLTIEQGTPRTKIVGAVDWRRDALGATIRAVHYGNVLQPGTVVANDYYVGRKTLIDLEGRYRFTDNVTLALGAENLFDVYPDRTPGTLNNNGVTAFPYYSPFGFNGRQVYGRLNLTW